MSTADNFNKSGVTNICAQYEARLEAAQDENQRLQRELDEAHEELVSSDCPCGSVARRATSAEAELEKVQQERDEARLHYGQLQQMAEANGMELLSVTGDRLLLRNNRAITAESRATAAEATVRELREAINKIVAICAPGRDGRHRQLCKIFSEIVDIQAEALQPEQVAAARTLLAGKDE